MSTRTSAAARRETEIERMSTDREKTGVFIGAYAINPMTSERIPIWIADYVLPGYGTGAIMAVPAHDERDYEFATKFDLPIRYVVAPASGELPAGKALVEHTADEVLIDSGEFTGMPASEAIGAITRALEERGLGSFAVTYRQRDWVAGRQRYWGAPIPIVYCDEHGAAAGAGGPAAGGAARRRRLRADRRLAAPGRTRSSWPRTCPVCGGPARRETDTMDTFVDSSLVLPALLLARTTTDGPFDRAQVDEWMPIHLYTGGAEHAVMHLMYFRFFTKALRDLGLLAFDEPTLKLRNQGQILGADHNRMSKSRGNVQTPGRAGRALRLGHGARLPDVHRAVGPGRAVEPDRDRRASTAGWAACGAPRCRTSGAAAGIARRPWGRWRS